MSGVCTQRAEIKEAASYLCAESELQTQAYATAMSSAVRWRVTPRHGVQFVTCEVAVGYLLSPAAVSGGTSRVPCLLPRGLEVLQLSGFADGALPLSRECCGRSRVHLAHGRHSWQRVLCLTRGSWLFCGKKPSHPQLTHCFQEAVSSPRAASATLTGQSITGQPPPSQPLPFGCLLLRGLEII
ncbi:hypothetical protein NDU88_010790 [Pleurodeles waltl]|uniref:Uncharacterized protein n=1 Tax=Pleurodeles waltl TaxID=8319 RepID=A0AAV7QVD0_PLEWA|nr:hypothetical protein NDU88_010790 [Pleurodeles waltl]